MDAFHVFVLEEKKKFFSGKKYDTLVSIGGCALYDALAATVCYSIFISEDLPVEPCCFDELVDDLTSYLKKDLFVRYQTILRNADEKQLEHFLEYFTPVCEEDEE